MRLDWNKSAAESPWKLGIFDIHLAWHHRFVRDMNKNETSPTVVSWSMSTSREWSFVLPGDFQSLMQRKTSIIQVIRVHDDLTSITVAIHKSAVKAKPES